jgi:hypothetical protein
MGKMKHNTIRSVDETPCVDGDGDFGWRSLADAQNQTLNRARFKRNLDFEILGGPRVTGLGQCSPCL